MNAPGRKGWCPGALRPMAARDGLLVRLRITGGILSAGTALALADLAQCCGNGQLDLSARGNLQIRGVHETTLGRLQDGLARLGILDGDAGAEAVRNVVASPLAGLLGGLDIRPLTAALEAQLVADSSLHALPPKFGFLIDDGSRPNLANIEADVRFDWDGEGFHIGLGGDRAGAAQAGRCAADELANEAARIAHVFLEEAAAVPGIRRMREFEPHVLRGAFRAFPSPASGRGKHTSLLAAEAHLPSPLRGGEANDLYGGTDWRWVHAVDAGGRRWPDEVASDEELRLLSNAVASGTAPHPTSADARATCSSNRENEGALGVVGLRTFASTGRSAKPIPVLGLAAPFGRLDAPMLHKAARLAEAGGLGELRLTPWRVIFVPGIRKAADLAGFITDPADARLSIAACVGTAGCACATTDVPADAALLASVMAPGTDVTLHVSGCAKGCAKATPSAITLVARDGRYDIVRDGRAGDPPWRDSLDLAVVRDTLRELA